MNRTRGGHFLVHALQSTVSGLLFAVVITTAVVVMQFFEFRPVRALEQWGIDTGMRVYANYIPDRASKLQYAFVDIDRAACERFLDGQSVSVCRTNNPVRTSLLLDLVKALRASNAAVIIVDVTPPDQDRTAWETALAVDDGPWVIAPIFSRPGDDSDGLSIQGDRRHDIFWRHAKGHLRLASVATRLDPELADGVVRHYPVASRLRLRDEETHWVPTIPYLAAQLARNEVDCRYFNTQATEIGAVANGNDCPGTTTPSSHASPIPIDNPFNPTDLATVPPVVRFFYSLPALTSFDNQQRLRAEAANWPVYGRYLASLLLKPTGCAPQSESTKDALPACFDSRPDLFEQRVVLIGSSSATALDRVRTPLGPMSGAEVILNATRAFAEFPAPIVPSFLTMWIKKTEGVLKSASVLFFFWIAIYAVRARVAAINLRGIEPRRRRRRLRMLRWSRNVLVVFIFVLGMSFVVGLELDHLIQELTRAKTNPEPVDMLLPVVALGVEGYTVAAVQIERLLHTIAEKAVGLSVVVSARVVATFSRGVAHLKRSRQSLSKKLHERKEPEE